MSLTKIAPNLFSTLRTVISNSLAKNYHQLAGQQANELNVGGLFSIAIRTNIRCYFPRPSERKRIKRHGWWQRMNTEAGRKILMRRILKGRHVYSH